jgi:hypothetical protein
VCEIPNLTVSKAVLEGLMSATAYPDTFDIGRVTVRAFDVVRHNLVLLIALTLILYGLPRLGASLLHFSTNAMPAFPRGIFSLTSAIYGLAAALGYCALQPAVFRVAAAEMNGAQTDILSCLKTGLKFLLPILGVIIVSCIGIAFGVILLIVPGLFLATIWSVASPSAVFERLGVANSLQRSAALTQGFRWPVFAIVIVFFIASMLLGNAFEHAQHGMFGDVGFFHDVGRAVRELTDDVLDSILALIAAVLVFSVYYELRLVKEGAGPEELTDILE